MASTAFTSGLWFLVIIAAIPLALWLLKRSPAGARFSGSVDAGSGSMRQIASLALSASQRVVTVEVGQGEARRWLVLGVTAQQISPLHTLMPPERSAEVATNGNGSALPTVFAQMLGRIRQHRSRL